MRQALEGIIEDGKRTSEIVTRIRALGKKAAPRRELLDVNEVILDVIGLTRTLMQRNDVALLSQLSTDPAPALGDRIQMQQVILNLILNAIEAMTAINGPRELHIGTTIQAPDRVVVSVSDTGAGFATGDLERLFDAFYTTKPEGMGMGLSICRTIVEAHGGRISALRNDKEGATLQFSMPLHRSTAA